MRIGSGGELGTETGPKCQPAAGFQTGRLTSLRIRLILKSHFLPAWNGPYCGGHQLGTRLRTPLPPGSGH